MRTDVRRYRRAGIIAASALAVVAGVLARPSTASSHGEAAAGGGPLPASITGHAAAPTPNRHAPRPLDRDMERVVDGPGVPVAIDIPLPSSHHPGGVQAHVISHALNPDHTLFVPADPRTVAWASDDAKPGGGHGTAILAGHINYVIDGRTVVGAFADLAEYARTGVGHRFSLELADGRTLTYRIVAVREYTKAELAGNTKLRAALYDQTRYYGPRDNPSGRLLLVSCGGAFDPSSGVYQDNVFVYALPVA